MISPACTEPYIESNYDPYSFPDFVNPAEKVKKAEANRQIQREREKKSPFLLRGKNLPSFIVDRVAKYIARTCSKRLS